MRFIIILILLLNVTVPLLASQANSRNQSTNPFFRPWTTPFAIPPFDQIQDEHFLPALKEGIAQQRREVEKISRDKRPAAFANTIESLDQSGELLDKVEGVFSNLTNAETNDRLQEVAKEIAPLNAALQDDILLNETLYSRVKSVWERREKLKLNKEQRKLLEKTYKDFIRGGANLSAEQKKQLRAINEELSVLSVKFSDNLLKETNAFRLIVENKTDLAGVPESALAAASEAAQAAGLAGNWIFNLQAPSIWPFLTYADNRELRHKILAAYLARCGQGNAQDNRANLLRIATLRAEKARILGYPTHADFVLEERMAKSPDKVYGLLNQLWNPANRVAQKESSDLQHMAQAEKSDFQLESWDWRYYAEKVKRARYDLDENEVRQYFTLDNVREGAFQVARKLYGLSFTERTDLPKYHAEVRIFEVKDADGSHLGLFLTDYHPRPGKRGGAWSSRFRGQYFKGGREIRPIVVNVCNFTRPSGGRPALLRQEEVETLFHEFGHGLHSLLSRIHYKSLAVVPRDFVELPSQIMENWALEPEVLKSYAKHWKTGEVIPDTLIAKIKKAEKFNQGFATTEYLAASFLDMDWHTLQDVSPSDADAFEKKSLGKIGLLPQIPVRYRSPYFQHIFSSGYSAGYYSYIWSEVLDSDAFQAFKEKGIFDSATACSFRKNILEKAGTEDAMEMFKNFRGREPSVEPLLEKRGLKNSE